ncbi:MAG: response regulator transcription factor [Firmicutes bacterium]|nr:response regulator transcription factor [Lachnospiraceae bacterium]MDD6066618.1 response regulator transcription factor [Bacillota bacterium]MDY2820636.1 response regulator transcription factor [Hominisplanchenecus sp.]
MEKEWTILIIEDDKYISNFICMSLKQEGYRYIKTSTGREAIGLCYANNPDVIILDLGLPDMDGIQVIEHIRSHSDKPIIVVSARQEESEKIRALDMGADDYVVKPFYMGELLARIRVAVRKLEKNPGVEMMESFEKDYLRIDFSKRSVYIDDREIHMTPIEYKLLALLVMNRGKVLTHNQILKKIWGYEEGADANNLRVFMATLRRKIEKDTTNPRFIITEVGVGYRFSEE